MLDEPAVFNHPKSTVAPHRVIRPPVLYFGTPVALVTTLNQNRTPNITPISSAWALADRLVLGVSSMSQGVDNIWHERECVVNMAPAPIWERVEQIARLTGRHPVPDVKAASGYRFHPNKFEIAELTPIASDLVRPPRIAECPMQLEARVVAMHRSGGGDWSPGLDQSFAIVEVKVERVHAHEDITISGTDYIDVSRWQPLFYVFRHYVSAGRDLGRTFKAEF